MLEKFKSKQILYPTVIMVLICLVVTAALAGTNLFTKDKIVEITKENEQKAMAEVLKADSYSEAKEIDGTSIYYVAEKDGKTAGYVFKLTEKGYGGDISVMVGVDTKCAVTAVQVLDVSGETAGLGQNTANSSFTKQFKGKSQNLTAKKYGTASGEDEIDAVASATITSSAVTRCVNKAVKQTEKLTKNEKGGKAK